MSKRSRDKGSIPNKNIADRNQKNSSPLFDSVIGKDILNKQQADLLEKDEKLREEIKAIVDGYHQKAKALDELKNEYESKILELRTEENILLENRNNLDDKQSILLKMENEHRKEESKLNEDKAEFEEEKAEFTNRLLQFRQEQAELEKKRISAKLGFEDEKANVLAEQKQALQALADKHQDRIVSLSEQIEKREMSIEAREQALVERESKLAEQNHEALVKLKIEWAIEQEKQKKALDAKLNEYYKDKQNLEDEKTNLDQQKNELVLKEDRIENRVRTEFRLKLQSLEQDNKYLKQHYDNALEEIKKLKTGLLEFADLRRELADNDVESIQIELEKLRNEKRSLKKELAERRDEGMEEENQRLETLVTKLEEELYELRREHEEAISELYANRLSSNEKRHLQQEKRILEAHNQALNISIEHLAKQLDELKGQDKNNLAFKALNKMDEVYRSAAINLQPVPDLRDFADIMQANIARQGFDYNIQDIRLFIAGLAMSKLHLLQGISGTGKTSLARTFARAINNVSEDEKEEAPEAYEKLILDSLNGDATNFAHWDEVAASWKFVDPIRQMWDKEKIHFPTYKSNTMGPKESFDLPMKDGKRWIWNPE